MLSPLDSRPFAPQASIRFAESPEAEKNRDWFTVMLGNQNTGVLAAAMEDDSVPVTIGHVSGWL